MQKFAVKLTWELNVDAKNRDACVNKIAKVLGDVYKQNKGLGIMTGDVHYKTQRVEA